MSAVPSDVPAGAALARYMESVWGIKTALVPLQIVSVLTTSTRVVKNNPRRMMLTVVNRGTGSVDLDWTQNAVLAQGVTLGPGATLTVTAFEDGELVGYELDAIAAAAGNSLSVYEVQQV